jgi:hypothetical protein
MEQNSHDNGDGVHNRQSIINMMTATNDIEMAQLIKVAARYGGHRHVHFIINSLSSFNDGSMNTSKVASSFGGQVFTDAFID